MDSFTSSFPQEIKDIETIQGVIHRRARLTPDANALAFLTFPEGQEHVETLSYAQLDRRAGAIADVLLSQATPGDRILLAHDPGLSFIECFFGCLYAGMIAVPLAPPRSRDLTRFNNIARDADAKLLLMHPEQAERWKTYGDSSLYCLSSDSLQEAQGYVFNAQKDSGDTLAFLQYTSGTTGHPKGVMVRQKELLINLNQIRHACALDASSIALNWLPLYHDMGLIGTLLTPLFTGFPTFLMSPLTFVQHPVYWLRAISRHRATICGGPSFAYQHCLEQIPDVINECLDLSSWRIAYCGAEMIQPKALENFAAAFALSGFHPTQFYPCYGMAEATLFITGSQPDSGALIADFDANALEQGYAKPANEADVIPIRRLVGCGYPFPDTDIRIVDKSGKQRNEKEVGEIWASGPGLAIGYWKKEEATHEIFAATLPDAANKRFLRTGDLGFFYKGQLFLSGRSKDLIIIDGRNVVPQDLEWVAQEAHPDVIQAAAFSVHKEGREEVVMLVEIERRPGRDFAPISTTIRRAVSQSLGVPLSAMALVRAGLLARTTSGKLARNQCRNDYLGQGLNMLHHWQAGHTVSEKHLKSLPPTSWLLRPEPHPAPALRLYCFGYGGGGASTFLSWRTYLDKRIEVCPVQLPSRENRSKEQPIRRLDSLYPVFENLAARDDGVNFAFCGYSMGGRIAFALAQHLAAKGLPGPQCLMLSAIREPSLMPKSPAYLFNDAELLAYATQFSEIPPQIKARPAALQSMLNLFRADMELSETIKFDETSPLTCPIRVFGGIDDQTVKVEHLLAWRKHTHSDFSLHLLNGAHMFLDQQKEAFLSLISWHLAPFLEKAAATKIDDTTHYTAPQPPFSPTSNTEARSGS